MTKEITINDIQKLLVEKKLRIREGLKRDAGVPGKVLKLFLGEKIFDMLEEDITRTIPYILPNEGRVLLSGTYDGEKRKIITFDDDIKIFTEAALDIATQEIIPTERQFSLERYIPMSHLIIDYYSGNTDDPKLNTGYFLGFLLKNIKFPVVELGDHVGDSRNRYIAMRNYKERD